MNTIIAAALAISLALGYGLWSWNKIDDLQEKNVALTAQVQQAKRQKKIDDDTILELDRKKAEIQIVEKEVIKEVVKYANNPNAGKCVIPADFVRIHDKSLSETSGRANETTKAPDTATPITDIQVLEVSTQNNQRAIENIAQCESLMKWVEKVTSEK